MAKQHFEDTEDNSISYATFVFMMCLIFALGVLVGGYHKQKQCKQAPAKACTIHDITAPPGQLPTTMAYESIEDIDKLQIFINSQPGE